jgi:hypothetical protein
MNDHDQSLMIHVERIVRDLRAGPQRKLRMRRELLGHLQAARDEELKLGLSNEQAIERAKQRLGDAAQLREELERAVPHLERALNDLPNPTLLQIGTTRITLQNLLLAGATAALLLTLSFTDALMMVDPLAKGAVLCGALMWIYTYAICFNVIAFGQLADPPAQSRRPRRGGTFFVVCGASLMLLQVAATYVVAHVVFQRSPSIGQMLSAIGLCRAALALRPVARGAARRLVPNDVRAWRELNLAE